MCVCVMYKSGSGLCQLMLFESCNHGGIRCFYNSQCCHYSDIASFRLDAHQEHCCLHRLVWKFSHIHISHPGSLMPDCVLMCVKWVCVIGNTVPISLNAIKAEFPNRSREHNYRLSFILMAL